jgi:hypothetical protein
LNDGESQIVEFSPGLPNHGAFFFLTYQHGSTDTTMLDVISDNLSG